MKIEGKRVLITGGSSGIGLALAAELIAEGASVAVSGRRDDRVEAAVSSLSASGAKVIGVAADVGTNEGRQVTLDRALEALGGLDILVNNAGAVRAGRLETTSEEAVRAMINVDLLAPILLSRAALPALRASGESMIVNVTSAIALIGMPFYSTYAAAKAGLAQFGEALRRELKGEGIHVLTVYPSGTDTPMVRSVRAGPELGFALEPTEAVAQAIVEGIKANAIDVVRGGDERAAMMDLNRRDPAAIDAHFLSVKEAFEQGVKDHSAL